MQREPTVFGDVGFAGRSIPNADDMGFSRWSTGRVDHHALDHVHPREHEMERRARPLLDHGVLAERKVVGVGDPDSPSALRH